jgi:hypothetical protein
MISSFRSSLSRRPSYGGCMNMSLDQVTSRHTKPLAVSLSERSIKVDRHLLMTSTCQVLRICTGNATRMTVTDYKMRGHLSLVNIMDGSGREQPKRAQASRVLLSAALGGA